MKNALTTFFLFVLIFSQSVFAQNSKRIPVKDLFKDAQATFNEAQELEGQQKRLTMLKAAGQFESLINEYGIINGYIYFNIGNAYYEAGNKGKAILNYRRAEKLIPGFEDLNYNLNKARNDLELTDNDETWWTDIVKSVLFWHYLLDYSTRRLLFIISFSLIWVILILMIFKHSLILKIGVYLFTFLTLSLGGSFAFSTYQLYAIDAGVIIKQKAIVRKGPGISYQQVYEAPIPEGTEFRVLVEQGDWWKARLPNGDEVWIEKEAAELI